MKRVLMSLLGVIASVSGYADWNVEESVFLESSVSRVNVARLERQYPVHWENFKSNLSRIENHFHQVSHKCFQDDSTVQRIPKIIHFIWLGPQELSREFLSNIQTWHDGHPSYRLIVWTDRPRALSNCCFDLQCIDDLELQLKEEFLQSVTYAEKTNILRYEILQQFGGLYVDVDVECHRSFDSFMQNFSFFIGMEDIWPMVDHHYLKTCNAVVGSVSNHPLWNIVLDKIKKEWRETTDFIQSLSMEWELNSYLVIVRSFKRSSLPFTDTVLQHPLTEQEVIVPPQYFGMQGRCSMRGLFCTHQYAGTWK